MTDKQLKEQLKYLDYVRVLAMDIVSLNEPVPSEELNTELIDTIESDCLSPEEKAFVECDNERLMYYINKLSPREQIVIKLRYGLDNGGTFRTLEDVSSYFSITRERIRQVEQKAMLKLKKFMLRDGISNISEFLKGGDI